MTDQAKIYKKLGSEFAKHDTVNHQEDEYARREGRILVRFKPGVSAVARQAIHDQIGGRLAAARRSCV